MEWHFPKFPSLGPLAKFLTLRSMIAEKCWVSVKQALTGMKEKRCRAIVEQRRDMR